MAQDVFIYICEGCTYTKLNTYHLGHQSLSKFSLKISYLLVLWAKRQGHVTISKDQKILHT